MENWNNELDEKFHINISLPGVFIDSWSQQPWNTGDSQQQEAFYRETGKLWDFSQEMDLFDFMTIEDVLEEIEELRAEVKWLSDVITNNISQLMTKVEENKEFILRNAEDINALTSDVDDLVANMAKLPMGTIIPWTPRPDADTSNNSDIPDHWQACDGSIIRNGPWAGRSTPDLNEQRRFLRGGPEKDVLMMED